MKNYLFKLSLVFGFLCLLQVAFAASSDSCECPQLSCNVECEVEQDLTFYSEKCEGGTKVRSCSRPTCVKLEGAPASCNQMSGGGETKKIEKIIDEPVRQVASISVEASVVGRAKFIEGSVFRYMSAESKSALNVGDEIREGDRIVTEAMGRVQIEFNSGNFLNITPGSEIIITEASDSISNQDKKRMVLDLIKGRVRSKVNQKYNGQTSYFRIRTKAAVAGVRGTDFAVSVYEDKEDLISKIETIEGKVELSDEQMEKKTLVAAGEGGTFVAAKASIYGNKDRAEFMAKGYLTPVYKMTAEQIMALESETKFALLDSGEGSRNIASVKKSSKKKEEAPICSSPSAKLNQCSWSCENNPGGEKTCRTDLLNVSCVRRICNANGTWSQATRLPAAYHEACSPERSVVKNCDY